MASDAKYLIENDLEEMGQRLLSVARRIAHPIPRGTIACTHEDCCFQMEWIWRGYELNPYGFVCQCTAHPLARVEVIFNDDAAPPNAEEGREMFRELPEGWNVKRMGDETAWLLWCGQVFFTIKDSLTWVT